MTDFLYNFLIGGISAALSKTVSAPFERVKLLLQTQDVNLRIQNGQTKRFNGIFNCFSRIIKEEGLSALWRGNFPNIIRYFPAQALNFAFKDTFKGLFNRYNPKREPFYFFLGNMASGGAAAATSLIFIYPLDFARTRLAADIGKKADRQFNGLTDCLNKVYKSDGFGGLYRGFGVTIFGVVFYRAIYFGAFDTVNSFRLFDQNIVPQIFFMFFLAQSVTITAGFLSYPLDTIRRRMMMQSGRSDVLYKNSFHCFKKIISQEGVRGLYKGFLIDFSTKIGSSLFLVFYSNLESNSN
ncbi:unnamed protein product [Paramecium sonneborni]|uniref:ADP/ATP translocase n=1 Tax=Paramecium sonneborni TaxID=65129 RepID=A0A8S1QLN1_9CILI|nr:unnamed protein product [Paramecium sonneborni]